MNRKILELFKKVGMSHFWGNYFDSRFYVSHLISQSEPNMLLDIGCGSGVLLSVSKAKLKIGLDFSFDSLRDAKLLNSNLELICGDATHLPFRDNFFSDILSIHLLVELKRYDADWKKALNELKRVASNKSKIILAGNNRASKHFKNDPPALNKKYLTYKEQEILFEDEFDVKIEGYDPHSKIIMYPLKKILFKIPEKIIDLLKIEDLLFRYLKSKRYLKNGRSYVIICRKIHQGITNV